MYKSFLAFMGYTLTIVVAFVAGGVFTEYANKKAAAEKPAAE